MIILDLSALAGLDYFRVDIHFSNLLPELLKQHERRLS